MKYVRKILSIAIVFSLTFGNIGLVMPEIAQAASAFNIRQEVNIIDGYLSAASGSYATSSAKINLDYLDYSGTVTYYFEVVASTTASIASNVYLRTSAGVTVATAVIPTGTTNPTLIRSSSFNLPTATSTDYVAVIGNETGATKSIKAARVVILQSFAGTANSAATSTVTQIEIGNQETFSGTATTTFSNPKYWTYSSSKWDGSVTAYAEVTYKVLTAVSSSTLYTVAGSYSYSAPGGAASTSVGLWGGGGAGGASTGTTGGAGGTGGQFASSTVLAVGVTSYSPFGKTFVVAASTAGGAANGSHGASSTWDGTVVVAAGGYGGIADGGATTTGDTIGCIGTICFAGGTGGKGTANYGAPGGGGAGTSGAGGNATSTSGTGTATGGGAGGNQQTTNAAGNNGTQAGGGGGGGKKTTGSTKNGGNGAAGQALITSYIATSTIVLQEDDGVFGTWSDKVNIVNSTTVGGGTETRARSSMFVPVNGRHYRIALRKNDSRTVIAIYDAKVIVKQSSLIDYYKMNNANNFDGISSGTGLTAAGQAFSGTDSTMLRVSFCGHKVGSPTGSITSSLYAMTGTYGTNGTPTGSALATASNSVDISTLGSSDQLFDFNYSGYALSSTTKYVITLSFTGGDVNNYLSVCKNNAGSGGSSHLGNESVFSASWTANGTDDLVFFVYNDLQFSLSEPQYLLANTKLSAGTSLQNFLTKWDSTEWSGVSNTYLHAIDSANGSASVVELDTAAGVQLSGSSKSSPSNHATSSSVTMPSSTNLDVKATTNNNDIYGSRILVQMSVAASPSISQLHYRWRNDNGTESGASYITTEDTAVTTNIVTGDRLRLRALVSNGAGAGTATSYTYQLEYASSSCSTWYSVPNAGANTWQEWVMDYSPYMNNGDGTSNSSGLTDPSSSSFITGYDMTSNSLTSGITLTASQFTELEYSIKSTTQARTSLTYCFRLTNAGSTSNFTYSVQPQIQLKTTAIRLITGGFTLEDITAGILRIGGVLFGGKGGGVNDSSSGSTVTGGGAGGSGGNDGGIN